MAIKEIHFSEARQRLSSILDQVEKSGTSVKILRHGKPVAVVINHDEYQSRPEKKRRFKLAGSIKFGKGIDVGKVIAEGRKQLREAFEARGKRLRKITES